MKDSDSIILGAGESPSTHPPNPGSDLFPYQVQSERKSTPVLT